MAGIGRLTHILLLLLSSSLLLLLCITTTVLEHVILTQLLFAKDSWQNLVNDETSLKCEHRLHMDMGSP